MRDKIITLAKLYGKIRLPVEVFVFLVAVTTVAITFIVVSGYDACIEDMSGCKGVCVASVIGCRAPPCDQSCVLSCVSAGSLCVDSCVADLSTCSDALDSLLLSTKILMTTMAALVLIKVLLEVLIKKMYKNHQNKISDSSGLDRKKPHIKNSGKGAKGEKAKDTSISVST